MKSTVKKILVACLLVIVLTSLMTVMVSAKSTESLPAPEESLPDVMAMIKEIVNKNSDLVSFADIETLILICAIVIGILGLVECLFGYPILKLEVFLAGFFAGFYLGKFLILSGILNQFLTDAWMEWVIRAICGLLVAFVAFLLFRASVFFMVALTVFAYARSVLGGFITKDIALFGDFKLTANLIGIIVGAVIALLIAFISIKLMRTVVILLTAFTGSMLFSLTIGGYIPIAHIELILLAVLFVIGVALQYALTAKKQYY